MAALSIHEPKLVVDVVPAFFDFSADLLHAETIVSAVATVSVHTGVDPAPSILLYQVVTITGSLCEQKIQMGLPGVVYDVLMTIVTSTSRTVEQVTRIAILPDAKPAVPVYIPLYFTSQPYPVDITDTNLTASIQMLAGHSLLNPSITEFISGTIQLLSGSLYGGLVSYINPHEDVQAYVTLLDGSLYGGLVSYANPDEGLLGTISMLDGSLYNSIVFYTNPHEDVQASISMLSGTLA